MKPRSKCQLRSQKEKVRRSQEVRIPLWDLVSSRGGDFNIYVCGLESRQEDDKRLKESTKEIGRL